MRRFRDNEGGKTRGMVHEELNAVATLADAGEPRRAPAGPQLGTRPAGKGGGDKSPFVVVGASLAAGVALATWIDRRGHARPRP